MKHYWIAGVICLLAAVGAFFAYRYADTVYLPQKRLDEAEKEQSELFDRIRPAIEIPTEAAGESGGAVSSGSTSGALEDPLAPCEEINSGTVGWIYIPDTNIDYPVVQGQDNEFYLHNGVNGQYNGIGCPFLDYRCEGDFSGFNSIVYAHNMEGRTMFADIALYRDEGFMESHPAGYLLLEDGVHRVDFFAYLTVPSTALAYHAVFITPADRQEYIDYIFTAASYVRETDIDTDQHLLLLSTCTFEYDEARGIAVGIIR